MPNKNVNTKEKLIELPNKFKTSQYKKSAFGTSTHASHGAKNKKLNLVTSEISKRNFLRNKRFKASKTNEEKLSDNSEEYRPKENRVRILYKEVGKVPKVKFINNTLEAKQKLVGGLIEVIPYNDLLLVCNDEGKNLNLLPNVIFDYDYIAGNCFVIGDDYKNADFKSLTIDEIMRAKKDLIHRSFKYKVQGTSRNINNEHGEIIK